MTTSCRPMVAALCVAACAAHVIVAPAKAQPRVVSFSGQGLLYAARTGGRAIASDPAGSAYVVESAPAPDVTWPMGVYVTKLDPDGRRVMYRAYVGHGESYAIAVDADGNAYVTGRANKNDFAPTRTYGPPGTSSAAFVAKLDRTGSLVYSVLVGGTTDTLGGKVAVDRNGNAYVIGETDSADFPTTDGAYDRSWNGATMGQPPRDAVVFKLDSGGGLVYSTFLGGAAYDAAGGIAVDAEGNAYLTGRTMSTDFPTTADAAQPTPGGNSDAFVTKLNAAGSGLVYSTCIGGMDGDYGEAIAVDAAGNAYVTGETSSLNFPITPGALRPYLGGSAPDVFVTKVDATGSSFVFSTYLGGGDPDSARGIAVDSGGNAFVTGQTASYGFPTTPGAIQTAWQGSDDAFVTELDAGGGLVYSTRIGSAGPDGGTGIAVDGEGDRVYVTGFIGRDFPMAPGTPTTQTITDSNTPFVARLIPRAALKGTASASSLESPELAAALAADGNVATRWSSAFADPQSYTIDLGTRSAIDRVVLDWETACASKYELQVSLDGQGWSSVYSATAGDGGLDDFTNLNVYGRYVRVLGVERATPWGYSLWEAAVFGRPTEVVNAPPAVSITSPADGTRVIGATTFDVTASASDADGLISRVEFSVNGALTATDSTAPFSFRYTAEPGTYRIRAVAVDNGGASASHEIDVTVVAQPVVGDNLALGRPVFSSSNETPALQATNAVDGSASTRWSSAFSDPQWIYADLGRRVKLTTVVLNWEAAFASSFELQVSDDASSWTTIATASAGGAGVQTLQNLQGTGRYVRMYATRRATPYGCSLWELQVYGTPADDVAVPVNVAAGKLTVASSMENPSLGPQFATDGSTGTRWSSAWADNQWIAVDLGTLYAIDRVAVRWEAAYASHYVVQLSNDAMAWRTRCEFYSGGAPVEECADVRGTARYVRVLALARGTPYGVSLWEFEVYGVPATTGANLAPAATATASSIESGTLDASKANDGDAATRWSSAFADGQWIALDFHAPTAIKQLVLEWENAFASGYTVQASTDNVQWRDVLTVANSDGGVDDLSVEINERYVRVVCDQRATAWGCSLFEIEAYGPVAPSVARWKMLVLIYSGTDFRYSDAQGMHHVTGPVSDAQLAAAAETATKFATEDVPALSSGMMVPDLTIRYPGMLTTLSAIGTGFWPAPGDVARDPAFDSVIVIWQPNVVEEATGEARWIGTAAGLAMPMGTGQTYAALIVDAATTYGHRNVFKHEYGHSLLFYFDATGTAPKPAVNNHTDGATYVHCGTGQPYAWQDESLAYPIPNSIYNNTSGFTHDYYSGTTALWSAPDVCLGITPSAWKAGGPVTRSY